MELSEILYTVISEHEEQKILSEIAQGHSAGIIKSIFEQCISIIKSKHEIKQDTLVTVAEGLLHYLLTVTMIPSKRKTTFQGIDIDVAVPDTITLGTSPQEVVIISFPKTNDMKEINMQIDNIKKIQPNQDNIWFVLEKDMNLGIKTYTVQDLMTFTNIIDDLKSFTSNKKQSKLKIFKI